MCLQVTANDLLALYKNLSFQILNFGLSCVIYVLHKLCGFNLIIYFSFLPCVVRACVESHIVCLLGGFGFISDYKESQLQLN